MVRTLILCRNYSRISHCPKILLVPTCTFFGNTFKRVFFPSHFCTSSSFCIFLFSWSICLLANLQVAKKRHYSKKKKTSTDTQKTQFVILSHDLGCTVMAHLKINYCRLYHILTYRLFQNCICHKFRICNTYLLSPPILSPGIPSSHDYIYTFL